MLCTLQIRRGGYFHSDFIRSASLLLIAQARHSLSRFQVKHHDLLLDPLLLAINVQHCRALHYVPGEPDDTRHHLTLPLSFISHTAYDCDFFLMGGGGSCENRFLILHLTLSGLFDQEVDTVLLHARLRLLIDLLWVSFWCDWQSILMFRQLYMRKIR